MMDSIGTTRLGSVSFVDAIRLVVFDELSFNCKHLWIMIPKTFENIYVRASYGLFLFESGFLNMYDKKREGGESLNFTRFTFK